MSHYSVVFIVLSGTKVGALKVSTLLSPGRCAWVVPCHVPVTMDPRIPACSPRCEGTEYGELLA